MASAVSDVTEEDAGEPSGRMARAKQEKSQRKPGDRGEREDENVKGPGDTVADDATRTRRVSAPMIPGPSRPLAGNPREEAIGASADAVLCSRCVRVA